VSRVVAFIRLGRPLFLGGGFLLFALGAAIAAHQGATIDPVLYVLGQLAVTAFQLMTHYANEYFDLAVDRANATPTKWSGGSRVLVAGELPPSVALAAARALLVFGAAISAVIAYRTDLAIATALAAIAILAWSYSAPPLRLCASGSGELATAIVVTVLVPWLGFALHGGPDVVMLVVAIAPLAMLQLAMLLAIEFPDAAGDAATGKRTLVVRLGAPAAARLYVGLTAGAYMWISAAWQFGLPPTVALLGSLPAPIALWRILRAAEHGDPTAYERLTFSAVFLLVATTTCELLGFLVLLRTA
jgi:1,4-dihydroxy-2-naphthoate octaprenyltransferase